MHLQLKLVATTIKVTIEPEPTTKTAAAQLIILPFMPSLHKQ